VTPAALAVVVPVLDEAERIGTRLAELRAQPGVAEIVVVDGGSLDETVAIAAATPDVRVVSAPRGRGTQANAGAAATTADVLLFLHADVQLPAEAVRWVAGALADPSVVAGAFRIRTVADRGRNWLGPLLRLADLRARLTRYPYGDQALFVRRAAFERVGGFPAQALFEDLELARRLWRVGRIRTVPACVRVSGRRFLQRPLRSLLAMHTFPMLYRLGVSPETLVRLYGAPR
jgi:rSAM/selenodomain-associated transferase 2